MHIIVLSRLQLLIALPGQQRLQNLLSLFDPPFQIRLHVATFQSFETLHLGLPGVRRVGFLLFQIFQRAFVAVGAVQGALHRIFLHPLFQKGLVRPEFVAHGLIRLLFVARALDARLGIEDADGGPPAGARIVISSDGVLTQVHVAERNVVVPCVRLHHLVPLRCLLASSASAAVESCDRKERVRSVVRKERQTVFKEKSKMQHH